LAVSITDVLTDVVRHAVVVEGSLTASIGENKVAAPTLEDDTLSWRGVVKPGQEVVVSYQVKVDASAWGVTLKNRASSTATPGTHEPFVTREVVTVHSTPQYAFDKVSKPLTGTPVKAGQRIKYTLTGSNDGPIPLDSVEITDDLGGLLAYADVVDQSWTATIRGVDGVPQPGVRGGTLTWKGELDVGQTVVVTYWVQVKQNVQGVVLRNSAQSSATPPDGGAPLTPEKVSTFHPVPGYEFTKTSDPASGTAVSRGQRITYTLDGVNTGPTSLDPVTITDDLSQVLTHASIQGKPVAVVTSGDGAVRTVAEPSVQGSSLRWSGPLEVGERVTVTYTVTVDDDAPASTLVNVATSAATPPGLDPIAPPPSRTRHTVTAPGVAPSPVPGVAASPAPVASASLPRTGAGIGAAGSLVIMLVVAGSALLATSRHRRRWQ
jgi:fimbrial isopeptide formation D2 family protein/uncharacterized repeat protein (TIGR01451 family)